MRFVINNKEYKFHLNGNVTASDIAAKLPLKLRAHRKSGHKHYADLPFTPTKASLTATKLNAGNLCFRPIVNDFDMNF
jgi:hypothetical protein